MTQLEKLLLTVSVLQWQALNGRAILYCDDMYACYLDHIGLIELFDVVDTEKIRTMNRLNINPATFWSLGRFPALGVATIPFVSLDCDLIVWNRITDILPAGQTVFTHWESTEASPWYPGPQELKAPPGYRWISSRAGNLNAANVSLLYFGDERLRATYVHEVFRFAVGNPAQPRPDIGIAPELLYAEQRLLPLIAHQQSALISPLIDAVWSPELDRFSVHDPRFGEWNPLRVRDQPTGITHGWFYKTLLAAEDPRRLQLVDDLTAILQFSRPGVFNRIIGLR